MKTDSLFYQLFKNAPELVLELAQINYANAQNYRFCSEEIKQTAFRLDGILTPTKETNTLPVIFVEVQFQPDQHFYSRFFCEIFFYLHQNKPAQPWQAIVIYPTRQTERDGSLHYATLLKSDQVKRIYLEDLIAPPAENIGLQLIQLIIVEEEKAIKTAQNLINRIKIQPNQKTSAYWLEWVETILVYKLPQLTREEIQQMLGYKDISLKETRFYQDAFGEGKQEGRQEGKQEGRQEGRQEGETILLLRIFKRRFGKLPVRTLSRIKQLNTEQREALIDHELNIKTLDDLNLWLNKI